MMKVYLQSLGCKLNQSGLEALAGDIVSFDETHHLRHKQFAHFGTGQMGKLFGTREFALPNIQF